MLHRKMLFKTKLTKVKYLFEQINGNIDMYDKYYNIF